MVSLGKKDLKLTYLLEKSDHDDYCSDNECTYSSTKCEIIIHCPKNKDYCLGKITNEEDVYILSSLILLKLEKIEDEIYDSIINYSGSGYCYLSQECKNAGLQRHDYRVSNIVITEIINK